MEWMPHSCRVAARSTQVSLSQPMPCELHHECRSAIEHRGDPVMPVLDVFFGFGAYFPGRPLVYVRKFASASMCTPSVRLQRVNVQVK